MSSSSASGRPLRIGVVGFGAAARAFVPALRKHPGFELAAVTEPSAAGSQAIRDELGLVAYAGLPEMLAGESLDVVYVATPTDLHTQHVLTAIAAGRHVLVEKPMTVTIQDAQEMIDAADAAGVLLMVGHSHSFDAPIKRMREIIVGGSLGRVRMVHTWCYTDWIYRPRRPEELKTELGGGVTYRQGSHQFDIIRLLCGGRVRSVRARTFDWDPARSAIGAHTVFLDFEDGPVATAVYNGYAGFSTMDLGFDISEWGFHEPPGARRWTTRPAPDRPPVDELAAKRARAVSAIPGAAPFQPFFGLTLVSCERGDIRQSPTGLTVHTAEGVSDIPLSSDQSPRDLVLSELYDAITGRARVVHDGRWGLANLAVCEAANASSANRREEFVEHQVAVP
jgi:phthalate 4,5-cis-dihydrodiol dehydrogenase